MDRPPIIQPKIEVKQERILTKEEVLERIYILGGEAEGLEIISEISDEKGLFILETWNSKTLDEDNCTKGLTFSRKGLHSSGMGSLVTNISSVYYDRDIVVGGENLVEFDEAKNVWTDYPPYPRNPDIK